ncbi:MAG: metal-dependent transcriptional regulator [Bacteroidetes bacterium]|nr:metal-dependent transcriptional regulator [Bacteroidota bacterium]
MTISVENFIKTIYHQSIHQNANTKLSSIAKSLQITSAAATDMAKKLSARNLVHYTKYKPLTLTSNGNKLALNIVRKHRLWECFLHQTLNLSLHEIHQEAENLEHATSDYLADKIEAFLGNPGFDPHGDPIPSNSGNIENDKQQILLSEAPAGKKYQISRLFSSELDFFHFCDENELSIGANIEVDKQYASSKMTEIRVNGNKILLNKQFTNVIFVRLNRTES